MIDSFRDRWLAEFFLLDKKGKKIPANIEDILFRKLQLVDDAIGDPDLRIPPANHFEALKGKLTGWCSIRVNESWRLIFRWNSGDGKATDLYLDNHTYR